MTKAERIERWAERTQEWMKGCPNSQPFDGGEVVWIDQHQSMGELLWNIGVPENCQEAVAEQVTCPCCNSTFALCEQIAYKSDDEHDTDQRMQKWYEGYAEQFEDFYEFIQKHPYLGATHSIGKEIHERITEYARTTIKNETWYRARSIKDGKTLDIKDLKAPNPKKHEIGEGRFNHYGQSFLYLASTKEGAAAEVLKTKESVAWVQRFKIAKLPNILDITNTDASVSAGLPVILVGLLHTRVLRENAKREKGWVPEYFMPRYVADCARSAGFNGDQIHGLAAL